MAINPVGKPLTCQYIKDIKMKLPTQAQSVDRSNRIAEAKMSGVNPAFWGSVLNVLKKAGQGALQGVLS